MRTKTIPASLAVLILSAFILSAGCEKKPPKEAKAVLTKALDALKAKDMEKFKAQVVPDQQENIVFDKTLVLNGHNFKELPLATLMTIPFFSTFTDYSIEKGYVDSKTESRYLVSFTYPKGVTGSTSIIVDKTKDGWKVNMKKSVIFEKKMNGTNAYSGLKLQK